MTRPGYIDGRRLVIGGMCGWTKVPALLVPGQMKAFGIMEDFFGSIELAAGESPPGWETDVFGGGGTFTIADIAGGYGLWQTGGANNDCIQSTLGSLDGGAFWPAAGHDIWFEARVKQSIAGVNQLNLAFGLQDPSAGVYLGDNGGGPQVNNHLMFLTLDTGAGNNAWSFEGDKAGAADRNALGVNLVSLVEHYYGFHVQGVTQVNVYYDRVLVAAGKVVTANIPVTGLMPFVCIKEGDGGAEAVYIDYVMCVQER